MSIDLPGGWREAQLGDVARIVTGKTPSTKEPSYWGGDIPFVTPSDITDSPWLRHVERHVSCDGMKYSSVVPAGSVLFTCIASIGKSCITHEVSTLNQQINACIPSAQVDAYFLYNALQVRVGDMLDLAGTTAVPIINKTTFSKVSVKLPPLDEQQRIAEVLRSVDEATAAAQQTLDFGANLLITMRRATFRHLIVEPDDDAIRLGDICELGRGFAFKSEDYVDDGILNFRSTNVGRPLWELGDKKYLPVKYLGEFDEYRLDGGEILLVMVGTVGKLGRVPAEVCPALLNQNMWTLTAKKPFDQELLWHFSHVLIEEKVHGAQGGAYSFLTKKDFIEHRIARFEFDEVAKAVANLSSMERYVESLSAELRQFSDLKADLMSDLLSGRVRVPA